MPNFEYKVVAAPRRGEKARGAKSTAERFALALTTLMNSLAQDGWEYLRADALPCDERSGLTGTKTSFQNLLVFRRTLAAAEEAPQPMHLAAPVTFIPVLGAAQTPVGAAPPLGPANSSLAAE